MIRSVAQQEDLPYSVCKSLGQGSYGIVSEVIRQWDGYRFAMKVIMTRSQTKKRIVQEFSEEVKNIQTLQDHQHFIKLFDAFETETQVGLVMWPAADCGSLAHCLDDYLKNEHSGKWLTPIFDEAFGCLASGLAWMHERRIRHKDIKPANILIHRGSVYCKCRQKSLRRMTYSNHQDVHGPRSFRRKTT
jgi:serine/threonine protein kinase